MKKIYNYLSPGCAIAFNNNLATKEEDFDYLLQPPKEYSLTSYERKLASQLTNYKPNDILFFLNTCTGIEIEIEGIKKVDKTENFLDYWVTTEDGSLRNNGREFITRKGFRVHEFKDAYIAFKTGVLDVNLTHDFSERCSIHIHVDIRTFTEQQLANLVACYIIFEKGLFSFCTEQRQKNIFCIPILDTIFPTEFTNAFDMCARWDKYTALNIKPAFSLGTVEFRHLHGTGSYFELLTWLFICTALVNFCKNNTSKSIIKQIQLLKYQSQYEAFIFSCFGELGRVLTWDYEQMDEAASCAKFILPKLGEF